MDISAIKPQERTFEIHHPADENELVGLRISIMSISDPRMKSVKRKIQDIKLRLEARNKHFKADDIEENQIDLMFSAMTAWEWYDCDFHGKKPEFTKVNVKAVLTELEWIADQIAAEISDDKAFFKTSKAN